MTDETKIELLFAAIVLGAGAILGIGGYFGTKFLQKQIDRVVARFGLSTWRRPR